MFTHPPSSLRAWYGVVGSFGDTSGGLERYSILHGRRTGRGVHQDPENPRRQRHDGAVVPAEQREETAPTAQEKDANVVITYMAIPCLGRGPHHPTASRRIE